MIILKAPVLTGTSKTTLSPTGQFLDNEFISYYQSELWIHLLLSTTTTISFILLYRSCTFVSLCNKVKVALEEPQNTESCFKIITKSSNYHINNKEKKTRRRKLCVFIKYIVDHEKASKAIESTFPCCLTIAPGYSLWGTRTAGTMEDSFSLCNWPSADKELKMRHKPTERHTFSVRTVTDNKYHVLWHIRKKKPSTLQFPHQKDCGWVLRFKSDLCFPTWLFVFCLITAFILYQIFLSEGFSGCQQLGSSASSQTMPEFRSEPRIPASRLGKRWDCYGGDSSPSISGIQPPSVSFTTPPLVPSSQFGLQLGSLLTKY